MIRQMEANSLQVQIEQQQQQQQVAANKIELAESWDTHSQKEQALGDKSKVEICYWMITMLYHSSCIESDQNLINEVRVVLVVVVVVVVGRIRAVNFKWKTSLVHSSSSSPYSYENLQT